MSQEEEEKRKKEEEKKKSKIKCMYVLELSVF